MPKVEAIIEEARRLPPAERRRLLAEVERSLERESAEGTSSGSYVPLLALAGTVASEFSDVSTDKYRHVAGAITSARSDE